MLDISTTISINKCVVYVAQGLLTPCVGVCSAGWPEWDSLQREMFYLTTHSTHFIYGYMASDIWLRTILIVRKETRCRQLGYSYRLAARVLLYEPSHRQDNTYHSLCYTSCGALAGTRNSSMRGLFEVLVSSLQLKRSDICQFLHILISSILTDN